MPGWVSPWEFIGFDKDLGLWGYEIGVWVKIVYFFRSQDIFSLDLGYIGVMGGVKGRKYIVNTGC